MPARSLIAMVFLTGCATAPDPEPIGYIDCVTIKDATYCEYRDLDAPEPWVNV